MRLNVREARNRLSELVRAARAGTEVVIAKNGRPMVRLVPVAASGGLKDFGSLKSAGRERGLRPGGINRQEGLSASARRSPCGLPIPPLRGPDGRAPNGAFVALRDAIGKQALYAAMKDRPHPVDLELLWRRLGVRVHNGGGILDDAAPEAVIRRAITAPPD